MRQSAFGINTREDLAQAQAIIRRRILSKHMLSGVTIIDPLTTFIEAGVDDRQGYGHPSDDGHPYGCAHRQELQYRSHGAFASGYAYQRRG